MRSILCYDILIQALKIEKIITYYKTYVELIGLKTHVDVDHAIIAKKI